MKKISSKILFLLLIILSYQKVGLTLSYKTKKLDLTIYNNGKAFITEIRQMNIKVSEKPFEIIFADIPETIDPTSLQITSSSSGFKLLDQSYEYNLINTKSLLNKYINKKLTLIIPSFSERKKYVIKQAVLISNNDRPIFMVDKKIYIGPYTAIMIPDVPKDLHPRPVLVCHVKNDGPETQQNIKVSYLANDFGWKTNYILKISKNSKSAFLSGWFSITNNTNMTFKNAHVRLVAGNIQFITNSNRYREKRLFLTAKRSSENYGVKERNLFEYHIYDIPRNITLKERQTKQINFIQSPSFPVKKILEVVSKKADLYGHLYINPVEIRHPDVYIVFHNKKQNGLGIPLPTGVIRVYKDFADGMQFIGEDRIKNIPENSKVLLNVGKAFDITIEKRKIDTKKLGKNMYELEWMITIKNEKDKAESIIIKEYVPGDWEFVKNPAGFKKIASNWIRKTVCVPAKGKKHIKYRVRCKL